MPVISRILSLFTWHLRLQIQFEVVHSLSLSLLLVHFEAWKLALERRLAAVEDEDDDGEDDADGVGEGRLCWNARQNASDR